MLPPAKIMQDEIPVPKTWQLLVLSHAGTVMVDRWRWMSVTLSQCPPAR